VGTRSRSSSLSASLMPPACRNRPRTWSGWFRWAILHTAWNSKFLSLLMIIGRLDDNYCIYSLFKNRSGNLLINLPLQLGSTGFYHNTQFQNDFEKESNTSNYLKLPIIINKLRTTWLFRQVLQNCHRDNWPSPGLSSMQVATELENWLYLLRYVHNTHQCQMIKREQI